MILVDVNEPDEMLQLIKQSVADSYKSALNIGHLSDYFFGNSMGETFQFSRKQAGEAVADLDEAERQVADYYNQAVHNFQIFEGIISPVPLIGIGSVEHQRREVSIRGSPGMLFTYHVEPSGFIHTGHSYSTTSAAMLYAWEHRMQMAGVATYHTMTWHETVRLLVTLYRNEQKMPDQHQTLKRIIKPKLDIQDADEFTKSLLMLSHFYKLRLGEKTVRNIGLFYHSFQELLTDAPENICKICDIRQSEASAILRCLGRE